MGTSRWGLGLRLGLVVLAVAGPAARQGHAAGPVLSVVEVFSNAKPGDPGESDPVTGAATIHAKSLPYGAGYEPGQVYVRGNARVRGSDTQQIAVDVVATDGSSEVVQSVTASDVDDPGGEIARGDFHAELRVTDLGVHGVADPSSASPADRGESTITVTVVARDIAACLAAAGTVDERRSCVTDRTKGVPSAPFTRLLTKFAGEPGDRWEPLLSRLTFPPSDWCHLSSDGGVGGGEQSLTLGGDGQGRCGTLAPLPDLTWVPCATIPNDAPARTAYCKVRQFEKVPRGAALVSGAATDDTSPFGIASEIADVTVQMTQAGQVLREWHSILRTGPSATWGVLVSINDFEPNFPGGTPYRVVVTVEDAWGNRASISSTNITIYPW